MTNLNGFMEYCAYLSALILFVFALTRGLKFLLEKYKDKSNVLLVCIYGLSIVTVSVLFYYYEPIIYKLVGHSNYSGVFYNNKSDKNELSNIKELLMTTNVKDSVRDADKRYIHISANFKVNSISKWNNIFQTAPVNRGLRMELAEPFTLALVIGTKNAPGFRGLVLTYTLDLSKWHAFDIVIENDNIRIMLDGKSVTKVADTDFDYDISDIAVGAGLSKTRHFDGEITDFKIDINAYKKRWRRDIGLTGFLVIISSLLFLIPYYFLSTNIIETKGPINETKKTIFRNDI